LREKRTFHADPLARAHGRASKPHRRRRCERISASAQTMRQRMWS
jgi:hypothetical protein